MDAFDLDLPAFGMLLATTSWGALLTLFVWGRLADVLGERPVVVIGLSGSVFAVLAASRSESALELGLWLMVAGATASA